MHTPHQRLFLARESAREGERENGGERERESCLLVLNLVSSTPQKGRDGWKERKRGRARERERESERVHV